METRNLGASGLKISAIAYGNWLTHGSQVEEEAATACVRQALDEGITTFDTADVYNGGQSEVITGRLLRKHFGTREEYVVATKVNGRTMPGPNGRGLSRKHVLASIDASLEEAARNMGASAWTCFRTVTLPLAAPGLMASAIFVFLESLDEFTGTYFVGVPDVTTLPLLLFRASMEGNYQIASITALILLVPSVAFMLVIERFLRADVLAKVGS